MSETHTLAQMEYDDLVDEFEQQWRTGSPPDIANFLRRVSSDSRLALLQELVMVDMEYRWKQSADSQADTYIEQESTAEIWNLENYLRRWPELGPPESLPVDLIVEEYRIRQRWGDRPAHTEYSNRFPGYKDSLPNLLQKIDKHIEKEATRSEQTPNIPGYAVEGELGRGGMGVVWRARHLGLNRLVALKMIRTDFGITTDERDRFRREAEVVARLQHANVVQIFDVGEHNGQLFLTFELVEGGSLAERLDGQSLPADDAAKMIETLARAMHTVHQADVVHRDLKPGNILLDKKGVPKIADFGLARTVDDANRQTKTGQIVGTPSYLAPEQVLGRLGEPGPATDVYALCSILYEMLVGRPPFRGVNEWDTIDQVVAQPPVPPKRLQPTVPRDLETICLKGLRKEPVRRYASAADLADDLQRFLQREPIRARRTGTIEKSWLWCRRHPVVAGLLVTLTMLITGGMVMGAAYLDQARSVQQNAELSLRQAEMTLQDLEERWQNPEQSARLLNDQTQWRSLIEDSRRAMQRAQQMWEDNPSFFAASLKERLDAVKQRLQWQTKDYDFIVTSDQIHHDAGSTDSLNNRYSLPDAVPKFVDCLSNYGVTPDRPREEVIEYLASRPFPIADRALAIIMELFVIEAKYDDVILWSKSWYADVLRGVDPDPWRSAYHQAVSQRDWRSAKKLLSNLDVSKQSPQTIFSVVKALPERYPEPIPLLERAVIEYPSDFWLHMELGTRYRARGKLYHRKAVQHFTAALAIRPKSAGVHVDLSKQLNEIGENEQAILVARRAVGLEPEYAVAHLNLGANLKALGKQDEAVREYELAIKYAGPDQETEARAQRNLGSYYLAHGDVNKAIRAIRRGIELTPKYFVAYGELGRALKQAGRMDEAVESYQTAIRLAPENYRYRFLDYYNLGILYQTRCQYDQALKCYDQAIQLNPRYAQAHCNRGNTLKSLGRFQEGLDSMRQGHLLGSANAGWKYPTKEWVKDHERIVEFSKKIEDFRAGQFTPDNAKDATTIASVCLYRKLFPLAIKGYEMAINQFNDNEHFTLYNAACAVALAEENAQGTKKFRDQGYQWLDQAVQNLERQSGLDQPTEEYQETLRRVNLSLNDLELRGLRDPAYLEKLPATEQTRWTQLWRRVAALQQKLLDRK